MEWFILKGRAGTTRLCTRLCTNEAMFSQHEGVEGRIGCALDFDFTLEIESPWAILRKPLGSNFQCLSQLIHHGLIAALLLSHL